VAKGVRPAEKGNLPVENRKKEKSGMALLFVLAAIVVIVVCNCHLYRWCHCPSAAGTRKIRPD